MTARRGPCAKCGGVSTTVSNGTLEEVPLCRRCDALFELFAERYVSNVFRSLTGGRLTPAARKSAGARRRQSRRDVEAPTGRLLPVDFMTSAERSAMARHLPAGPPLPVRLAMARRKILRGARSV